MMERKNKKEILIEELANLRRRITEFEKSEVKRKRTEEELQESEEKFRCIAASAKDAIIMIDNDGKISCWNKAAKKIFGYSNREALGKECHIFLGPNRYHIKYRKGFSEFKKTGRGPVIGKILELEAVKKDGTEFPIELSVSAAKIGGKWNAIGVLKDITDRKKTQEALYESEEKYKALVESATDFIFTIDKYDRVLSLNRVAAGLFRKKPKNLIGKSIFELFPKNLADKYSQNLKEVFKTGRPKFHETEMFIKGRKFWTSVSLSPIKNGKGEIISVMGVTRDITDLKRAEEGRAKALAAATAAKMAEDTIESMTDSVVISDRTGRIVQINEAFSVNFGCGKEAIGKHLTKFVVDRDIPRIKEAIEKCLRKGEIRNFECTAVAKNNKEIPALMNAALMKDSRGKPDAVIFVIRDITERKAIEEALRQSEEQLHLITDALPVLISYVDSDERYSFNNQAYERWFGHSRSEIHGKHVREVLGRAAYRKIKKYIDMVLSGQEVHFESEIPYKRAGTRYIEASYIPHISTHGKVSGFFGLIQDISKRKHAERRLNEVSSRQEAILAAVPDIIMEVDRNRAYTWANRAGYEFFGNDVLGREAAYYFAGEQDTYDVMQPLFNGDENIVYVESWQRRKDGAKRLLAWWCRVLKDADGKVIGALSTARDITERIRAEQKLKEYSEGLEKMVDESTRELRETQDKLIKREKLAVLGQIAGGIGHELRNPLGAIKNAAYFLNMALDKSEPEVRETLELLEKEIASSERIISSLLGFARPKSPTRHRVKVCEVVEKVLSRYAIPENVKVVTRLNKSIPPILADPDQLYQIIGNIALNAVQAMPEGGELIVKSRLQNSQHVVLTFRDTGNGIPKRTIDKLFEPLFTTKARGIGLGLAMTKTLVEAHGGTIEVESKVGKGSTFAVKLPTCVKS